MFYHPDKKQVKNRVLYLASQSRGRRNLLETAQIPHQVIEHKSDECGFEGTRSFEKYVLAIAKHKMEHVVLPNSEKIESDEIFVLTADTLMRTSETKKILGKPKDKDHAKSMLKLLCKEKIELVTACCLDKKIFIDDFCKTIEKEHWTNTSFIEFCVEKDFREIYLEKLPQAMGACGAGIIEDFGMNFLKTIKGSYSSVIGLPLFELREKLQKLGFFYKKL